MQLTQKKTTATFKQLDGVIRATKPDGSKTSYTNKCGELDKTVPIMIGVSRAVLESVIFCHQEDAAGRCRRARSSTRERFDDIFDGVALHQGVAQRRTRSSRSETTSSIRARWRQRDVTSPRPSKAKKTFRRHRRDRRECRDGKASFRAGPRRAEQTEKGLASKAKDISGDLKGLHADKIAAQDHLKRAGVGREGY